MWKYFFALLLIFSHGHGQEFYDLNENIFKVIDASEIEKISYTKNAFMAAENFPFPQGFLDQTRKMITRENAFRNICSIADGTNIAQLCVYGIEKETQNWKVIEIFDTNSCRGQFYLSGNTPVLFAQVQDKASSATINVQKVSYNKGFFDIRQRSQPILEAIQNTIEFLKDIEQFIVNPNSEALLLAKQAKSKNEEIKAILEQRDSLVKELEQNIIALETKIQSSSSSQLEMTSNKFILENLKELSICLRNADFAFQEMTKANNHKNLKELIDSIRLILSSKKLDEVFNSKNFNLGCSEPLILFDLFNSLARQELIRKIPQKIKESPVNTIIIQLHSTKIPCRSCLLTCCGHVQAGLIKELFQDICNEFTGSELNIHFFVTYHSHYEDSYPFNVLTVSNFNEVKPESFLLANMEPYDETYKRIKNQVIKQDHERLKITLLNHLEKKSHFTLQDIEAILK